MNRFFSWLIVLAAALTGAVPAHAQGYINQNKVETILQRRATSLDALPEVYYEYQIFDDPRNNTVLARNTLYKQLGDGDQELGQQRVQLIELLNRVTLTNMSLGDTLVVPTEFGLDFRAYSPFPRYYPAARDFEKLFIIHKNIQAFAAYAHGKLDRWGVVNTGDPSKTETPNGRFNFNWKTEYRISSLSPPGEDWEMYWVFNFHDARGIHIHQYTMPQGGPTSHGCVRLIDADAKWIYNWADAWTTSAGGTGLASRQGRLLEPGTTVLVLGDEPSGRPHPFLHKERYPVLRRVELPTDPYDVPPGTPQQELFDKKRAQQQASR
ncbi:MAG: L,D-transpeptidase family protein [Bacteroidetes bacterium]|jgi:hypothetical protein|nr:L,D-transpeptidase family protein [Bacteroidota bacterium]